MPFVCDLTPCYCDENCQSGFETDREYGVIYPQMAIPADLADRLPLDAPVRPTSTPGVSTVPWTVACDALGICRYCKKEVPNERDRHELGRQGA